MATLPVIDGWLSAAFGSALPVRVGKQTKIKCYTEIEFDDPALKGSYGDFWCTGKRKDGVSC